MDIKQDLLNSAKHFAEIIGTDESTIKIDGMGRNTSVSFGDYDDNGYEVSVSMYDEDKVDRIIISLKKYEGKSFYAESRDQQLLEHFLNQYHEFYDWVEEELEYLELRFNKYQKELKGV